MNFAVILFLAALGTGVLWVLEHLMLAPARRRKAAQAVAAWEADQRARGGDIGPAARRQVEDQARRRPAWLEYTAGLFPVFIVVFLLRSFLFEPFKIPSGSMIPTLLVGDLILVNKYAYGVRLPIVHTKVLDVGKPARGDVMVFRFPKDESLDYIKRVVGLPGDTVGFQDNRLVLNGKPVPIEKTGEFYDVQTNSTVPLYSEKLGEISHNLLTELDNPAFIRMPGVNGKLPDPAHCTAVPRGFSCKVPEGHYFMLGDNRESSEDSRYWGFVPEKNIVGRAFFIWMNFGDIGRIGSIR
ncbi:MAG: signal peptidase I [Lautropia sp.]